MSSEIRVFRDGFNFEHAIEKAKVSGYFFAKDVISDEILTELRGEIDSLPLEEGIHITNPINVGRPNEVRQQHERLYVERGNLLTPVANLVIEGLTESVKSMRRFPELHEWQLTEIGYQRYRHSGDFISAHRDRASDKLLSLTITIAGSAPVRIFETIGDYWDYSKLQQRDEFITTAGSVMLLRAPGLGNSEQIVHRVLPPISDSRSILNLRMRTAVLEQPSHPKWQNELGSKQQ